MPHLEDIILNGYTAWSIHSNTYICVQKREVKLPSEGDGAGHHYEVENQVARKLKLYPLVSIVDK